MEDGTNASAQSEYQRELAALKQRHVGGMASAIEAKKSERDRIDTEITRLESELAGITGEPVRRKRNSGMMVNRRSTGQTKAIVAMMVDYILKSPVPVPSKELRTRFGELNPSINTAFKYHAPGKVKWIGANCFDARYVPADYVEPVKAESFEER